jgi:hypothetical protein
LEGGDAAVAGGVNFEWWIHSAFKIAHSKFRSPCEECVSKGDSCCEKKLCGGDPKWNSSDKDKATSARFAITDSSTGNAEAAILFSTRTDACAKTSPSDRISNSRLAEIDSEWSEINRFAVGKAHG